MGTELTVLQRRDISDRTRSHSTLGRIDYADVATIATSVRATPDRWARAIVEHSAGRAAQVFWRAIGLRLDRSVPAGHIGGWTIAARGEDWLALETASWYAGVNAICEIDEGHVSLTLLARYDHPFARIACPPITLFHRRGIPFLLRIAAKHLGPEGRRP